MTQEHHYKKYAHLEAWDITKKALNERFNCE